MYVHIQLLPWDSDFFNIKVGKVYLKTLQVEYVDQIYKEAKRSGIQLIYVQSESPISSTQLRKGKLNLVDIKTDLRIIVQKTNESKMDWNIIEYTKAQVTDKLKKLAYKSGIYSRFSVDPLFPKILFKKLYRRWIMDSVHKKLADVVFICVNTKQVPIGFVTIKVNRRTAHIGLICVMKKYRKKNIGTSLLHKAMQWSYQRRCRFLSVTTQKQNVSAINLFHKAGYLITKKTYFYHYWIYK